MASDEIGGMCRFYDKEFPDVEESVIVNVKRIAEMGAYVQLLEYNNLEGMILLSELSRRRIRSISKLLRVGKNEVVMVIRVDKEKKYIDLSKRRVSGDDIRRADERFNKSKTVHGVLRHVSERLRVSMLSLYERVAWPLSRKYGHALDAFQLSVADPGIFAPLEGVSEEEKRLFEDYIKLRMKPKAQKLRADVKVFCFAYEGVEAVKEALMAAQALSTEEVPITVQLIAPPLYVMLCTTENPELGLVAMAAAIEETRRVITAKGGELAIEMAPCITTAQDDSQLDRMLEQLKADEEEGDEEEEEEGGEGAEGGEGGAGADEGGLGSADFEAPVAEFGTVRVPFAAAAGGGGGGGGGGGEMSALEKLRAMQAAGGAAAKAAAAGGGGSAARGGAGSAAAAAAAAAAPVAAAPAAVEAEGGEGSGEGASHAPVNMDHVFGSKELELQHAQTVAGLMGKKKKVKKATAVVDDD